MVVDPVVVVLVVLVVTVAVAVFARGGVLYE
jgi:hypothetical protein